MGEKVMDKKEEETKEVENEKMQQEEIQKQENSKKEEKTKSEKKERKEANKEKKEENNKNKKEKEEKELKFKKSEEKPKKQEKEMNKMENDNKKKSKKKFVVLGIIIGILLIIGIFVSTIFALINISNENIINGVSINGIDVSGLSKEEAKTKIESIYNERKEKDITLKHGEYETTLSPVLMEVSYKIDEAVENAYSIGKSSNIFINNYDILFALISKKDIPLEMNLNEEVTRQTIEDMNINLPDVVIESSHSIEDDELIITKGKAGIKIDTDNLLTQVKDRLNNPNSSDDVMEMPVINKEPDPIDIDNIHEEVYQEAQDAYIVEEPFEVHPEVEGIDFDVEAAREMLKEDKEEYVIPLIITEPDVTLDELGEEAFPDQLATFTTRYDVSDVDRTTNLRLACQKINGTVLLAGETFSYNDVVGARTVAAGYKNAKIYEAGQVVDGLGGGICQISSTLYNAALYANLEIVERRNHQFVTSYVPAGRDATVVYGSTDFKFKNTRQYPIRIVATANAGIATISIYGIKEENEYTFKFSTKTVSTIPYSTQYIDDSTLPQGTEVVKQKGANGLITETYITKLLNGKTISTELLSRDTYSAMTRIVRRGTGAETNSSTKEQTVETTTPEPTETPTVEEPATTKPEQPTESTVEQPAA